AEAAAIMKGDRKVIDEGRVQILDEMITVPSGEVRTFLSTKGPIFETNGEKKGIFGVAHDITQRKQMEETLKKNARDIHTLVENASDMIIRYSKDFRYMYCNKAVEHEFGIPVCDYIGRTSLQLGKYEEFGKSNEESLKEVLKNGKEMTVEQRIVFPSGEKWFQKRIVPERNENGEIESFLAISRDITEYKKATDEIKQYQNHLEELVHNRTIELFESEKRYREILNSIADYIYMIKIDKDKIISAVYTDRCYAVTGYQPYEFYENHSLWLNIVFEEDRRMFKHFIKNILTGQEHSEKNIEHRIITKNGSLRWVRNTVVINKNSDGEMTGYDGVIIDITDLKNAEDEIRQLNLNIINLQEEERQRVSANLHDSVGQTILAAKINIDTYKQDPVFFADQLDVGLSFIIQASRELKEIYTNLYPLVLNDLGFEMAVRWLVGNTLEKMNVKADINSNITNRLPHNIEVALFRILQEIVSNIIKHASASKVYLSLTCNGNQFELVVKDNGIGFNPGDKKEKISGYGLSNIKYRVAGFNGKLSIGPNYPHGTIIRITIDLSSSVN
ncbi:MAG TPA: PAS domain S-box protein, partial [Spirochaetota bacterium]|nr:PAS domain S-box protein [Spirochaetota bacterium]